MRGTALPGDSCSSTLCTFYVFQLIIWCLANSVTTVVRALNAEPVTFQMQGSTFPLSTSPNHSFLWRRYDGARVRCSFPFCDKRPREKQLKGGSVYSDFQCDCLGATFHHECGNRHGPKDRSWLTRSHYIPSQETESKQEAMSFPPGEPGSQPLVTYLLQGCASESPHIHQYQLETKSLNI